MTSQAGTTRASALLWRKAWADISNAYLERAGSPERIDHRSNAERRGIDELPTVHMGVAACQMEKKGIATEKGELNRNIQKANRLIREIRAQIGKLKEWIGELFKARETAPEQPPQSPGLANLLIKYMSVQREKSRKYSQYWQRQHAADELKTVAAAVNYLSEHGISTLDELDAALSSVSEQADAIRAGMKTAEQRMKELQKLIEYGRNYQTYKPVQDEYRQIRWKGKQEKVCGSPPSRAYPLERGKPLSPCPFAGGRENAADFRMGERICRPQSTEGNGIRQAKRHPQRPFRTSKYP